MSFASYSNIPAYYGKEGDAYYDRGQGVPQLNKNNMTPQDIYRTPFLFLQEHRHNYTNMADDALKGIQTSSDLSQMFFSDSNIREIQRLIRKEVYIRTQGQFKLETDQEQRDLYIAMRAVYMEYARFLPSQIKAQVHRLNMKVIDEILPGMLTELRQYYGYLKEINKPLDPIARPLNVNNKGRRSLPSVTNIWK